MANELQSRIIAIIQETLKDESGGSDLVLKPEDSMETVPEWDSLSFMKVFLAINEAFGIKPDFDDAIHFTSIPALTEFLQNESIR